MVETTTNIIAEILEKIDYKY